MKNTRIILILCTFVLILGSASEMAIEPKTNELSVMVVAGGHAFDTVEFVDMLTSIADLSFDIIIQPNANQMIATGEAEKYDVIVFYDMWPKANSDERTGYINLLEQGKGMVFLHHSLVSYQSWDEFKSIIGGKYYTELNGVDTSLMSTYKHEIEINVKVASRQHPVTSSLQDFKILDEGYGNIEVNPEVQVLLTADHPDCAQIVAWENSYKHSKIVYLMFGHDKHAFANSNFQRLLTNAIIYVKQD